VAKQELRTFECLGALFVYLALVPIAAFQFPGFLTNDAPRRGKKWGCPYILLLLLLYKDVGEHRGAIC